MKEREALKLALEALEDRSSLMKWQTARHAIKEALAQPELRNQCGETCERAKLCAICANGIKDEA